MAQILLLLLCVLYTAADQGIGTVNPGLDPDRITWWKGKWSSAPILLSVNNRAVTGVSATFYFTPTTTITAGVLEIQFPAGFGLTTVVGANGQIYQTTQTLVGGVDAYVTVPGVTNPSALGPYGPFALRTRYSATGQTIDLNLSFGSVYIVGDAGTLGSLAVSLGSTGTNSAINKSGNSLLFKFTIAVSLWRFDTFVINTDYRWTVGTTAGCSSQDYTGRWNNFNGSNPTSPHSLNCIISGKTQNGQTVYIYGLAVQGVNTAQSPDNQYVALLVNSVTTPDRVLVVNNYSWSVSTTRFGTNTVLETGSVSGSPSITTDVIYSATWKPTWGMPVTGIIQGLSVFMDLAFPIANSIPQGGGVAITVSEDVISGSWPGLGVNCYVVTLLLGASCSTGASGAISINSLPLVPQGTFITIRNIVKFTSLAGAGAKAISIKTYDGPAGSSNTIDYGQNLPLLTISSAGTVATSLDIKLVQGTGVALPIGVNPVGGTGDGTGYLTFRVLPSDLTVFTATSQVTFYCPLTSSMDDFNLWIPVGVNSVWKTSVALPADMTTGTTAFASPSITPGSNGNLGTIQWAVPTGLIGLAAGTYISIAHYMPVGATVGVSLPRVAVNLATAYECRMEIVDSTGGKQPHRFVSQVTVSARPYAQSTFQLPCLDGVTGAPGLFQLSPALIPFLASSSTATYYLEFQINMTQAAASTATGLTIGTTRSTAVSYPVQSSASGSSATLYADSATTVTLLFTGYSQISPGLASANILNVYFPLPTNLPSVSPTVTISSTYILQSDPRYAYLTFQAVVPLQGTTTTPSTGTAFATATGTGTTITNGNYVDNTTGLVLSLKLSAALTQTNPWVYFLMPVGTTWGSNRAALASGGGFGLTLYFSSPTITFALPGLLVQTASGSLLTNTAVGTYTLKGFALPIGASASLSVKVTQGDSLTAACVAAGSIPIIAAAGTISSVTISPNSVIMKGPDGVNIQLALTFQLAHGIPAGGSIQLVISPTWQTTSCGSICSVTGLSSLSLSVPLQCLVSTNTATITSFADFQNIQNTMVTLTISRIIPPISASTYNFVQSLSSFTPTGAVIDTYTVGTSTQVTVTTGAGTGLVIWQDKKTFPMNALATLVDLYLRFSLAHMLPACGVITLTSPLTWRLPAGDIKNNCYVSPTKYTSCSLTSAGLQVVMSADTPANTPLEVYLDSAVDNPGAQTSSGFHLSSAWYGVTIDSDPTTIQSYQLFTPTPLLTSLLTPSAISASPLSSGETATYTFNFTDSVPYTAGDLYWILFPQEFDLYLGDISHWFTYEPNTYYIPCSSPTLGTIWCTVDHGIVVISGKSPVTAGQLISISLIGVINPAPGTTSNFAVCHLSSNSTYLTVKQGFGTVTLTSLPLKLDFREISPTSHTVQQTSTLVFRFYLSETIDSSTNLQLTFPSDYDLTHFAGISAFPCSTTYTDESNSQQFSSLKDWNQATSCPLLGGNRVILPAPKTAFAFTSNLQVSWSLSAVPNPQTGMLRTAFSTTSDFDVWDTTLWPAYPSWTRKFTLFVYKAGSVTYSSRAYSNLHSVYMGLSSNSRSLIVTSTATGSQTSRITVYSGTQSTDFFISTGSSPCADKSLTFTPSTNAFTPDNGYLRYTSAGDKFRIAEGGYSARFRVVAAAGLAKGLYLIDWKVTENSQPGVTVALYTPLPSTTVEVYQPSNGQFQLQVAPIPIVLVGYSSVPILITCPNAPESDLIVSLSILTSPPYLTLSPASLTFSPDVNELYFQIQVGNQFSTATSGTLLSLTVSLSGTDAAAYSVTSPIKFPVGQSGTTPSAGNILTWGIGSVGRTKAVLQAKVDQAGVIYWYLAAFGSPVPSFADLRSAVTPLSLNHTYNSTTTRDQGAGETWTQYQTRLLKVHLMTTWVGWLAVSDPTIAAVLSINWLWAGCTYQISGYLDNLNPFPVGVTVHTETFITLAVAPVQPFSLKFQGAIASSQATAIGQLVAKYQGINPQRLLNPSSTTSFARRSLQTLVTYTTFSYTLVPARDLESSNPATEAVVTALTSLQSDLNTTLGITSTLYSMVNTAVPTQIPPIWSANPKAGNATSSTFTISMRSSVLGSICCEALLTSTDTLTAQQVLNGLTPSNEEANYACSTTNMTQTVDIIEIGNLTSQTNYYIYCTAEDNYPLWPTAMVYSASSPLLPIAMQTSAPSHPSNVTSTATALVCLLLSLLA